ncbi:major facilitator superfamily domain-containing protein [Endogone sp. FLAS-F59071]|nr:major facilitator superfamily domain-containing protein [Endogone sp. FLAS-F59071]|eukprot:RUS18278.1 major facilitator superfamily domain-containing protein [Endogone sp. FLAS-F59071]
MTHAVIEPTDLDPELLGPIEVVPALVDENESDDVLETSSLLRPASIAMEIAELQSLPWHKRPSAWWIIIPFFITSASLTGDFFNTTITDDIPYEQCQVPEIQAMVVNTQAIIQITTSVCVLLVTGYYGALSDRIGRKFVISITVLGSIFEMLLLILTQKYQDIVGIRLLFIAPVIRGLTGGFPTSFSASQAYISDCTQPSDRAVAFGRIAAMISVGGVIGPSLSSIILKTTGAPIVTVFYLLFFVEILYFLFISFVIPESNHHLKKRSQQQLSKKPLLERLNIFSSLGIIFRTQTYNTQVSSHALPLLALLHFIGVFSLPYTVFILYAMFRFKWTSYESGIYFSVASAMRLVVLLGLLPLVVRLFKEKEEAPSQRGGYEEIAAEDQEVVEEVEGRRQRQQLRDFKFDLWLLRIGGGFEAAALTLQGLAPNTASYYGASFMGAIGSIFSPSMRSLITNIIPPTQTGEVLGAVSFLDSLAGILSPLVLNPISSATTKTMPNLIFFITSGLFGIITVLTFLVRPSKKNRD